MCHKSALRGGSNAEGEAAPPHEVSVVKKDFSERPGSIPSKEKKA
jgi:hypothetical protein